MVEIREVKTKNDLKKFILLPFRLYKDNKYWVPPLIMDELNTLRKNKNPAFEYCDAKYWLAYKDGKIAGRIAGIINHRFIEIWGQKLLRFGWVDFIDDQEVSAALFGALEGWASELGLDGVHGPLGFCDLDKEGMLIEGFEEMSMFITIYNYPYYPVHLETLGYIKDVDWIEYDLAVPEEKVPEKVQRVSEAIMKRLNLRLFRAKKAKEILPYAKGIFEVLNEAYKNLYGVVPLTDKQVEAYTKQYFSFINPDYIRIVLDKEDKVAAFGIAMPSLTDAMRKANGRIFPFGFIHILRSLKKAKLLDLYLVAVRPELQSKGINALLLADITKVSLENGISRALSSPELELNTKVQAQWKHYSARLNKRRRCFIKNICGVDNLTGMVKMVESIADQQRNVSIGDLEAKGTGS